MSTSASAGKKAAGTAKKSGKPPKSSKKEGGKLARVTAPLNLREAAGYDQKIIRILQTGEKLILQGQERNGFAEAVTQSGERGWVCTDFIETETVGGTGNV